MDALVLMERLGGEILANKIRATIDDEIVIIANMEESGEWVYTDDGQELANLHSNLAVDEANAAYKPSRKKAAPAVESAPAPAAETPAVEAEQPAAE
jgi:hypothetical protein